MASKGSSGISSVNMPDHGQPQQDQPIASLSTSPKAQIASVQIAQISPCQTINDSSENRMSIPGPRMPSCISCRRRKVSCDNLDPCTRCQRSKTPCVFPPRVRAPRRPRAPAKVATATATTTVDNKANADQKQREDELQKRVLKLEGILEVLSTTARKAHANVAGVANIANKPQNLRESDATSSPGGEQVNTIPSKDNATDAVGKLVFDESVGAVRYLDDGFLRDLNLKAASLVHAIEPFLTETNGEMYKDEGVQGCELDNMSDELPNEDLSDHGVAVNSTDTLFVLGSLPSSSLRGPNGCLISPGDNINNVAARQHVLPAHVVYLWQVYQENVEPLVKLLHVPSSHAMMLDARRNPERLSPAENALFFSICHSAVVSLDNEEVQDNLGEPSKEQAVQLYRRSLEQALANANFLSEFQLATIQALCLFTVTSRSYDNAQYCWTLVGLVIRIAKGMGLHRDGSHLKLPALDVEIRRRVWWAINAMDLRCAEEMDSYLAIHESWSDTRLPSNINDTSLTTQSTREFPAPVVGWSDCAVVLVRYQASIVVRKLLRRSPTAAATRQQQDEPRHALGDLGEANSIIDEGYQKINEYLSNNASTPFDSPLFRLSAIIARILMSKAYLVVYHREQSVATGKKRCGSEAGVSASHAAKLDQAYFTAVEAIECDLRLLTDPELQQYQWICKTYFNWRPIVHVLLTLGGDTRLPWTPQAERGWQAVVGSGYSPVDVARSTDRAALFVPMRKLYQQAERHRTKEILRLKQDPQTAHQLDSEEAARPCNARFGPIMPGWSDQREKRRQWWIQLVQPYGDVSLIERDMIDDTGVIGSVASSYDVQNKDLRHTEECSQASFISTQPLWYNNDVGMETNDGVPSIYGLIESMSQGPVTRMNWNTIDQNLGLDQWSNI